MSKWIIVFCLLLTPVPLIGQERGKVLKETRLATAEELENVITESKRIADKNSYVNIAGRAAAIISLSDPVRGEQMLLELWKFSNSQTDKNFDAERARVRILKYLHSRNSKLARQLLAERLSTDAATPARLAGFDDESTLPGKLAASLLDTDAAAAGAVLEQNLTMVVTNEGVGALAQLRQRNFLLADYIAAKVIDAMPSRPTLTSLPGLHLLGAYAFPGSEAPAPSMEAESSRQSLQYRYFAIGLEVLRASLNESIEGLVKEQHYTPRHLQFRGAFQAELAAILSALAPRFQPALTPELSGLAARLAPQVPPNMPRLSRTVLGRLSGNFSSDNPEERFVFALSGEDFDAARNEIERIQDADKRNLYGQVLIKSEARALLARGELMEAVTAIRKLDDPTTRLLMYMDALRVTQKKRDADVAKIIINEARLLVPQTNRNGMHLRALFAFASQLTKLEAYDEAIEFLNGAVTTINALGGRRDERNSGKSVAEEAMAELNDPNILLDELDMEQAFTAVGLFDLDAGLSHAKKIQPKPVQLMARLQTIQGVIKQNASKPKPAASPAKVTPPVNSVKP
jgi:hypothetical protein